MADQKRYPSTDELDYQRRADEGFAVETRRITGEPVEVYAPFAVEGNDTSGYIGVSPEYMTYASETEKPMHATEGTEELREQKVLGNVPVVGKPDDLDLDADTSTQGGGSTTDLVYTAHSGSGYTAKKAEDAPVEPATDATVEDTEPPVEPSAEPKATSTARNQPPAPVSPPPSA